MRRKDTVISIRLHTITDRDQWNDTLRTLPYAHFLQTWEWGAHKHQMTGWLPHRWAFERDGEIVAMASVGVRRVGPFALMYAPKGPVLDYADADLAAEVIAVLQQQARRHRAIFLKLDPDVVQATGVPGDDDDAPHPTGQRLQAQFKTLGFHRSGEQIQFPNTVTINLTQPEDDILMAMSQNTRRKVRQAEKKGVTIREATLDDLQTLYDLYKITGERDGFLTRPFFYYETLWRDFMRAGLAQALIAEYEGRPIAHVILSHFGRKCWYFMGASSDEERQRMPNYALQWAAIRWAKAQGYTTYDFWGAPTVFDESDRMWGVYQFKRGFRGTVTRYVGAWDYAPLPPLYTLYTRAYPRVIDWLRRRG